MHPESRRSRVRQVLLVLEAMHDGRELARRVDWGVALITRLIAVMDSALILGATIDDSPEPHEINDAVRLFRDLVVEMDKNDLGFTPCEQDWQENFDLVRPLGGDRNETRSAARARSAAEGRPV